MEQYAQQAGQKAVDFEAQAGRLQQLVNEQDSKLAMQQQVLLDTNKALLTAQAHKDSAIERSLHMTKEAAKELAARKAEEEECRLIKANLDKQFRARQVEAKFYVARKREVEDMALQHGARNMQLEKEVENLRAQVQQQQSVLHAQHEALAETTKALYEAKEHHDSSALAKTYAAMDEAVKQLAKRKAEDSHIHRVHQDARSALPHLWKKGLGQQEMQRREENAREHMQQMRIHRLEEELAKLHGVSLTQGKSLAEQQMRLEKTKEELIQTQDDRNAALENAAKAIENIVAADEAEEVIMTQSREDLAHAIAAGFKKRQWNREFKQSQAARRDSKERGRAQNLKEAMAKLQFTVADQFETIAAQREALEVAGVSLNDARAEADHAMRQASSQIDQAMGMLPLPDGDEKNPNILIDKARAASDFTVRHTGRQLSK